CTLSLAKLYAHIPKHPTTIKKTVSAAPTAVRIASNVLRRIYSPTSSYQLAPVSLGSRCQSYRNTQGFHRGERLPMCLVPVTKPDLEPEVLHPAKCCWVAHHPRMHASLKRSFLKQDEVPG